MTVDDARALVAYYVLTPAQDDVFRAMLAALRGTSESPDLDLFPVFMHLFTDAMCFEYATSGDSSPDLYSSDLLTRVQDLFVAKLVLYKEALRTDTEQ